ncbi:Superfamily II DNA or RNA helicase [Alteromonadaceae bacterium Bs31]|nr:Superfamily II DNA or RNA helicase [Alteromonadaceae bacterium Bs31]
MLKLRQWQAEAITAIHKKYELGNSHFLCLATPGAGKTLMASVLAKELLASNKIDLVICFSPSINIATALQFSLEKHIGHSVNGRLGAKGHVMTYQSMLNLDQSYWEILSQYRVLAIFDEIHHCAGDQFGNGNSWGQKIVNSIQGRATFTLALTGTPWRSDKIPIALSRYCTEGKVICDYSYGLDQAIRDRVCRIPKIVAIDNENISVREDEKESRYKSFEALLTESTCSYQQVLNNTDLINQLIKKSAAQLESLRKIQPDTGALIVAASIGHAVKISELLKSLTGDDSIVVTHLHEDAQKIIQDFRSSSDKWIIAVGMISEGTDIPRLRVCCHLSRVKTELAFRQVLGRILRSTGKRDSQGYLFIPAEPNLIRFAKRVAEDVPDEHTVRIEPMEEQTSFITNSDDVTFEEASNTSHAKAEDDHEISLQLGSPSQTGSTPTASGTYLSLSDTYNMTIGFFGRFKQKIIQPTFANTST